MRSSATRSSCAPSDLTTLAGADLAAHRDAIAAAAQQGRADGNLTSESLGLLRRAVSQAAEITAAIEGRARDATQLDSDADAALAELGVPVTASTRRTFSRAVKVPQPYQPRRSYGSNSSVVVVASGSPDGSARFCDDVAVGDALFEAAQDARPRARPRR